MNSFKINPPVTMLKKFIVLNILLLFFSVSFGQENYTDFLQQSTKTNNTGMIVLGTWAVANMATGAVGWSKNTETSKYFHQMNFFWNTVNLTIAGFGLYQNLSLDISNMSAQEIMDKHQQYENLFLINAGLDVLYVGTGYYLTHLSKIREKRKHLLQGYGNSIMLQGGFLFAFDIVMYTIQRTHRMNFLEDFDISYFQGITQIHYSINF